MRGAAKRRSAPAWPRRTAATDGESPAAAAETAAGGDSSVLPHFKRRQHRPVIAGHRAVGITRVIDLRGLDDQVRRLPRVQDVVDPSALRLALVAGERSRGPLAECDGPRVVIVLVELLDRALVRPRVHVAGDDLVLR